MLSTHQLEVGSQEDWRKDDSATYCKLRDDQGTRLNLARTPRSPLLSVIRAMGSFMATVSQSGPRFYGSSVGRLLLRHSVPVPVPVTAPGLIFDQREEKSAIH